MAQTDERRRLKKNARALRALSQAAKEMDLPVISASAKALAVGIEAISEVVSKVEANSSPERRKRPRSK